ncbi:hypothetical protein [Clostridium magnum]|uniref:Uncharacterized protein n=1 Tax=Clostridium magnum DSM 2767 TaxID=1121326 RepID=A0A162TLT2_9CLOT|nr:hypothetical protein [Clostridium magnum]KZL92805.1 hypothetical protein CLMAG_26190 [Clostridium magnum DSM 2767]SHI28621.1 hypothetical protein SAMN02745944_04025 [Clostridium magnum DSM 2767]
MDETLVFSWTFIMKFILGMALFAVGIYFVHQTPMVDISKAYAEQAAVQGGFTAQNITDLKADLGKAGFDTSKLTITLQAFDINGTNISSKVYPVTPFNQTPYPATPNFAPRGSKIYLIITSSEDTTMTSMSSFLGGNSIISHGSKRTVMSERLR